MWDGFFNFILQIQKKNNPRTHYQIQEETGKNS